ncbi:MAG: SGNH/GDSL hydrolase family protein [Cyclobacteriaceae bacterium]
MKTNKFSRRKFFERSLCLAGVPLTLMSLSADREKSKRPGIFSFQDVPDKVRISELLKQKTPPLIWVFTGDSITHGAKHTQGYRSYPEIFAERIRWELGRTRDVVINTGISGNTTQTILNDFDWRIKQFKPAVVSLMIGTNDCAKTRVPLPLFEENLYKLVKGIRDLSAIPILHTPNIIIIEKDPVRSSLPEYIPIIRNICSKEKVILVDNYRHWQESLENNSVKVYNEWLNDPLHPDGEGHSEIARLMFRELSIFDPAAPTCGGPYYEGEH